MYDHLRLPVDAARPARRVRSARIGALAVVAAFLALATACRSQESTTATLTPSSQDALRIAAAEEDPIMGDLRPRLGTYGPPILRPYSCADGTTCQPTEGYVTRVINQSSAPLRTQLLTSYISVLRQNGWVPGGLFCDDKTTIVTATKAGDVPKAYPARLQITSTDIIELRVTVPAYGTEPQFKTEPDAASLPKGECSAELKSAFAAAQAGAPPGTAPPGTAAPATVPSTTTTTAKPKNPKSTTTTTTGATTTTKKR